jgi:hypothetical protein
MVEKSCFQAGAPGLTVAAPVALLVSIKSCAIPEMNPTRLLVILALVVLATAGCGRKESTAAGDGGTSAAAPTPIAGNVDAIASAYVEEMETMGSLFKRVTDEASAKKHAPEIRAASDRLHEYAAQLERFDPMKRGMAFMPHAQRLAQIQQQMAPEVMRISRDPALAEHIGDSMTLPKIK